MHDLEKRIGYRFQDRTLLEQALSHSSYANEVWKNGLKSYERLEFLGDSILGFVTAEYLYRTFPNDPEGDLTKLRSELVCENSLVKAAETLRLGDDLHLGKGEEGTGGRQRASILADVVESIIAAIYLDGGFSQAKRFIFSFILVDAGERVRENADYKTALQELVQRKKNQELHYELLQELGPDHDKQFQVRVLLNGTPVGVGMGTSKKRAEQAAAREAIAALYPEEMP